MSPGPAIDPRHLEEEPGLDVGTEPGAGLGGYPGMDGDIRIISREIYQGKTFDDWDDMEANVRRLARKAGFKVVKVSKNADDRLRQLVAVGVCVVPCASTVLLYPAPPAAAVRFEQKTTFFVLARNGICDFRLFFASDPPTAQSAQRTRMAFRTPPGPCCCFGAAPDICFFFCRPNLEMNTKSLFDHELEQRKQQQQQTAVYQSHHIALRLVETQQHTAA